MQLFVIGMHLYTVFDKSEEDYVCREKMFVSMVLMLSLMFCALLSELLLCRMVMKLNLR